MTVTTTGATALIESSNLPEIEHHGQRVITLASMDAVHQRAEGTARRNFNANKDKLVEGEDYFVRNSSEAKQLGFTAPNGLTLLTESGYLLLVKSFTDDLAWRVQRQLVNGYFRAVGRGNIEKSVTDTLIPSEQQTLSELVHRRVAGADSALQGKALAEIWSRLHRKFRVAKYNQLPRTQLSDAIAYVMGMQVKALAGASTTPPHVNERLSGADLQNIKRMIYNASRGFQFQGSWNQAVWFYLRLALNLPSPQPFGVDHLPRLAHELQRVNAITSQVQDLIYEIEGAAAKRLFRKVESVDVVMADLRRLAAERMAQLKDDADRLPNYMKSDIAAIVNRTETGYWGHLSNDEQPGYFDHYNSEGAFA